MPSHLALDTISTMQPQAGDQLHVISASQRFCCSYQLCSDLVEVRCGGVGPVCLAQSWLRHAEELVGAPSYHEKLMFFGRK